MTRMDETYALPPKISSLVQRQNTGLWRTLVQAECDQSLDKHRCVAWGTGKEQDGSWGVGNLC